MHFAVLFVLSVALTLQILAAGLAARLIRVTGMSWAWLAIAAALGCAAIRRGLELSRLLGDQQALVMQRSGKK